MNCDCGNKGVFRLNDVFKCRDHKTDECAKTIYICSIETCTNYTVFTKSGISYCAEHTPGLRLNLPNNFTSEIVFDVDAPPGCERFPEIHENYCVHKKCGRDVNFGIYINYFNYCVSHEKQYNCKYKSSHICITENCCRRKRRGRNNCSDHKVKKQKLTHITPESITQTPTSLQTPVFGIVCDSIKNVQPGTYTLTVNTPVDIMFCPPVEPKPQ